MRFSKFEGHQRFSEETDSLLHVQDARYLEDAQYQALRQRILRRHRVVSDTVAIGALRLRFTRIADPDDMAAHMEMGSGPGEAWVPKWPPYWAAHWDAAWAVTHTLLDLPLVGRTVLDLGCGLGLTGAASAVAGAARVWMVDAAPPSLLFARLNTWPWRDRVRVRRLDWRDEHLADRRFDLIVGSDIIYDEEDWPYLERFWRRHLAAEGRLLLGESGRRTGVVFPGWLADRGWSVRRRQVTVSQCPRPLRILWCAPDGEANSFERRGPTA